MSSESAVVTPPEDKKIKALNGLNGEVKKTMDTTQTSGELEYNEIE